LPSETNTVTLDELFIRRAVVLGSALVYWVGVWFQARRVRKRIGRSPNLKPRGLKERLLYLGWFLVVAGWIALPLLARSEAESPWIRPVASLLGPAGMTAGVLLMIAGYAGTLWCYAAMGEHWRIGADRRRKGTLVTVGPYRGVRHPIYLFQIVMLAAVVILLPAGLPVVLWVLHVICVVIKARDEETHLLESHREEYRSYMAQTGMLLPPWFKRPRPANDEPTKNPG
jgi:protein-S-isoprenylcysteine O-methyltransferase Ste14